MQNSEEIKVSVICLAYNHEKYIRHTLEGFVNQKTDFKYEVLVNDDASTDSTADIIREYETKYPEIIKPIYQSENQYSKHIKISNAFLYPKAKGEYFAFCEGDDYWCSEDKLQRQYDALQSHPECSICTCKVQCINEDGSKQERIIPSPPYYTNGEGVYPQDYVAEVLYDPKGEQKFHTSACFVRRTALKELMDNTLPYSKHKYGDQVLYLSALSAGSLYYVDKIMTCYRQQSIGSWSTRVVKDSKEKEIERWRGGIQDDLSFDEYTDGKYHKWIMRGVANKLCVVGQDNPSLMRATIAELGFTEKEIMKNCTMKNRMLFWIASRIPAVFQLLLCIRNKLPL